MILMILKRTSTGGILKPKRKQCRDAADDSLGNDSSWTRMRDFRDSDKLNLEVWDCESASSRFYSSVVSLLSRSHGSCCLMLIKIIKIISYSSINLPCVCEGFSGEIMWAPPSILPAVEVYLELLHAAWDGEGGAVLLHVHSLLLLRLPCLLLQHRLTDLQQQALRGRGGESSEQRTAGLPVTDDDDDEVKSSSIVIWY